MLAEARSYTTDCGLLKQPDKHKLASGSGASLFTPPGVRYLRTLPRDRRMDLRFADSRFRI
jgi:hypothetical protein